EIVSRGPERFADAVAASERLTRARLAEEPGDLPAGAGPGWLGRHAIDPDGGREPHWSSHPPALLVLPEVSLHRSGDRTLMTLCAISGADVDQAATADRLEGRLGSLREARLPLPDPHATSEVRIASILAPERFERSVERAVERIGLGELDKVVLAREVVVEAPRSHEPAALYGALREL